MPKHNKEVIWGIPISVFYDHPQVVCHVPNHIVQLVFLILSLHSLLELIGFLEVLFLGWGFWFFVWFFSAIFFLWCLLWRSIKQLLREAIKNLIIDCCRIFCNRLESCNSLTFSIDTHPFKIFLHLWIAWVICIEIPTLRLQHSWPFIAQCIKSLH